MGLRSFVTILITIVTNCKNCLIEICNVIANIESMIEFNLDTVIRKQVFIINIFLMIRLYR